MGIIFSTTIFSFALFLNGLVDMETGIIKEIDSAYRVAESSSDLYKLEVFIQESLHTFPESSKIFWRLGRTYFKLGEKSDSEPKKIRYFLLCMEQTKKALNLDSKSANGYFFNGLCNGSLGQVQGIWSSLGKIKPFKMDMETAISLDPTVNEGGPHRALANLYLKLPYLLGGDLNQSIIHFREAVRLGPQSGENYLGLAEAYIQNGDYHMARDTLETLLDIKPASHREELLYEWKIEASNLLKKITE